MQIYARYIANRIMGPFLLISMSLTGLVWLAQSLKFIDFIVNRGLDAVMFLYLSSLLIPSLLGIVLPIALFISVVVTYNRLASESELVVMRSAGISRVALIKPTLIVSILIVIIGYLISLYLLPSSYREFKDMQAFIRDNYVSVLLQEGVFNSPTKDLTVYIRKIGENGKLEGMLMHDNRIKHKPVSMMAEEGELIKTPKGPRFILKKGNRQEIDHQSNNISLLYFDRYALDMSSFTTKSSNRWREPEERYLHELFIDESGSEKQINKLRIEGHNRITWPLYSMLMALLGLTPFIGGEFNRRGQLKKILYASVAAVIIISSAVAMRNIANKNPDLSFLMYLWVLAGISGVLFYLLRENKKNRERISTNSQQAGT